MSFRTSSRWQEQKPPTRSRSSSVNARVPLSDAGPSLKSMSNRISMESEPLLAKKALSTKSRHRKSLSSPEPSFPSNTTASRHSSGQENDQARSVPVALPPPRQAPPRVLGSPAKRSTPKSVCSVRSANISESGTTRIQSVHRSTASPNAFLSQSPSHVAVFNPFGSDELDVDAGMDDECSLLTSGGNTSKLSQAVSDMKEKRAEAQNRRLHWETKHKNQLHNTGRSVNREDSYQGMVDDDDDVSTIAPSRSPPQQRHSPEESEETKSLLSEKELEQIAVDVFAQLLEEDNKTKQTGENSTSDLDAPLNSDQYTMKKGPLHHDLDDYEFFQELDANGEQGDSKIEQNLLCMKCVCPKCHHEETKNSQIDVEEAKRHLKNLETEVSHLREANEKLSNEKSVLQATVETCDAATATHNEILNNSARLESALNKTREDLERENMKRELLEKGIEKIKADCASRLLNMTANLNPVVTDLDDTSLNRHNPAVIVNKADESSLATLINKLGEAEVARIKKYETHIKTLESEMTELIQKHENELNVLIVEHEKSGKKHEMMMREEQILADEKDEQIKQLQSNIQEAEKQAALSLRRARLEVDSIMAAMNQLKIEYKSTVCDAEENVVKERKQREDAQSALTKAREQIQILEERLEEDERDFCKAIENMEKQFEQTLHEKDVEIGRKIDELRETSQKVLSLEETVVQLSIQNDESLAKMEEKHQRALKGREQAEIFQRKKWIANEERLQQEFLTKKDQIISESSDERAKLQETIRRLQGEKYFLNSEMKSLESTVDMYSTSLERAEEDANQRVLDLEKQLSAAASPWHDRERDGLLQSLQRKEEDLAKMQRITNGDLTTIQELKKIIKQKDDQLRFQASECNGVSSTTWPLPSPRSGKHEMANKHWSTIKDAPKKSSEQDKIEAEALDRYLLERKKRIARSYRV